MPALLELQLAFAAGLRDRSSSVDEWAVSDGIPADARLRVYRNNARALFEQALQLTFPVVHRRVGDDYFRQLAHHFRAASASRAGDLHEIGRPFADFLAAYLTETPYAWLAELAALEWAIADAGVAADSSTASAASLGGLEPEALAAVRFELVPSLRRIAASLPVLSVWRANQPNAEECVVDLSAGPQCAIVHRGSTGVELREVTRAEFDFISALGAGATLDAAVETADVPLAALPMLLHWLFRDGIVAAVLPPAAA
jgi:hypothetical protein